MPQPRTTPPTPASSDLGVVLAAVADPTRRAILDRLAGGTATVTELAEPFEMSLPAVSKHLKVLERAGLLNRTIVGRVHHCRAVPEPLEQVRAWLAERGAFWDRGLESLRSLLDGPGRPGAGSVATPEGAVEVRRRTDVDRTALGGALADLVEAADDGATKELIAVVRMRHETDSWRIASAEITPKSPNDSAQR